MLRILYVCVALVIQHPLYMRRLISSSLAFPSLPYFSELSHKWHDFRKNVTEHNICFDLLYVCPKRFSF
jgi:hypothetical protein